VLDTFLQVLPKLAQLWNMDTLAGPGPWFFSPSNIGGPLLFTSKFPRESFTDFSHWLWAVTEVILALRNFSFSGGGFLFPPLPPSWA